MTKELIVSSTKLETKVAILEKGKLTEIFLEQNKNRGILGNIYKGRVTRVLPGMQAAFVDIGLERHAFLYVSDFFDDHEEYEGLFNSGEEADREPGTPPARQNEPEDSKRVVRSRRKQRSGGRKTDTPTSTQSPQRASVSASRKAVRRRQVETDSDERPSHSATAHLNILPHTLPLGDEARKIDGPEGRGESTDSGILPDRLADPTSLESNSMETLKRLPSRVAELKHKPPLDRLETRSRRRGKKQNRNGERAPISDLLRENQEILVQVAKEPIGGKGARITSHIALPGRFLVFTPTVEHIGVSRKIVSEKERQRLRKIVLKLCGKPGKRLIVRTVGEKQSETSFQEDMDYLTKLWGDIRIKAEKTSAPGLVHSEPGLVHRIIRDYFSEEFSLVRVDDDREFNRIVEFVNKYNPELIARVRPYNKNTPIFDAYGITGEIEQALRPKIWLKNGGYIVINQTEALVAIDVNTGRFVGKTGSLEETITRTNLAAVLEIVRQIRLRDLGGIIVIDFIDMHERKNRKKVIEALHKELSSDKSPSKVLHFNEFGLVAITRRRVKQSLERTLCQPCTNCSGRGMTKSVRTICHALYDEIYKSLPELKKLSGILLRCHPDVGEALKNGERLVRTEIESLTGQTLTIQTDSLMRIDQFDIAES